MGILEACVLFLRAMLVPKARLAIENLALRQQVAVFKRHGMRFRIGVVFVRVGHNPLDLMQRFCRPGVYNNSDSRG